ncbi:putative gustatory receptor 28b [Leptopilina heterotoma]|uniref:putative gustatory receptor 28b n=1 Tax=Leptopilina heterotoma TaxID=63436 RepID=UPI001CA80863|nr:putative gustatory receptor 28b [Leptopilina heterotoma]
MPSNKFSLYFYKIFKWEPSNIHDSIVPVLILNWITGLNMFEYPLSKARPFFTFFYVLLLNLSYWIVVLNVRSMQNHDEVRQIGRNIFILIVYINSCVATISIVFGWINYKAFKANLQKLESLDGALENVGIPHKYRRIFISSMKKLFIWLLMAVSLIYSDLNLFLTMYDMSSSLNLLYLFHFPLQLNSVVDFTFTALVTCVERRFASINSLLEKQLPVYNEIEAAKELFPKHNQVHIIMATKESNFTNNSEQLTMLILVRYLHMELSKVAWELNRIYEKQLMMRMGSHFMIITGLLYNLFTLIFFVKETFNDTLRIIISNAIWFGVYCYRFLKLNSTCARVSSEARRTRNILFELKNTTSDKVIIEEIEEFALQLTQRPLAFSAGGLSTLDYSFVRAFIGSVTTYLVLLIQFSPEMRKCNRAKN